MATRLAFDAEGLEKGLAQVRERFGGRSRVFLTGYAGGGNLLWWMVLHRPDSIAAAAPVSGVFWGPFGRPTPRPEHPALPIRGFQGTKTTEIMSSISNGHWEKAAALCQQLGIGEVRKEDLETEAHGRCVEAVLDYFEKLD